MSRINQHLEKCLQRLQKGEDIETCLRDYPDEAEELRQLLMLADRIQVSSNHVHPSSEFIQRTQNNLESAYQAKFSLPDAKSKQISPFIRAVRVISFATALIIITLLGSSVILAKASEDTMPGHFLYPLKLAMEEVRLSLTFSEDKKISKLTDFAETRAGEIVYAADIGDDTKLEASLVKIEDYLDEIQNIFETEVVIEGNGNSFYLSRIQGIVKSSSEKVQYTLARINEPPAIGQPVTGNEVPATTPGQQPGSGTPDTPLPSSGNQTAGTGDNTTQPMPSTTAPQAGITSGDITQPAAPAAENAPPETANNPEQPAPQTGGNNNSQVPPEETPSKKQEIIERVDKAYEKTIKEIEKAKEEGNGNTDSDKGNGGSKGEGKGQGQNKK